LLLLTSLDALKEPMKREAFRLDQQIKDVIQKYRWLMEEKNIMLSLETEEVNFTGQKEYTEKIRENILSNAIKYTPEGGMIDIILKANENEVTVTFSDTGIGINETHFEKLFERFYRVDSSRHQKIEGTGLGLSIVKQAVELHAGTINVSSKI